MRQVMERCLRGAGAVALVCAAAGCPKDGGGDDDDDDPGHDVRIEISDSTGTLQNGQLVAIQDGDGAWTSLSGTGGVYTAHIEHDRFGVVLGCIDDELDASVQFHLQTVGDGTTVKLPACGFGPPADTFSISGPIANLPAEQFPQLSVKNITTSTVSIDRYNVITFAGATDLFASTGSVSTDAVGKVIRKKDLNITADTTIPLDFAADGVLLDTSPLTGADIVSSHTVVVSDGGRYRIRNYHSATAYESLPASLRKPGDTQTLDVFLTNDRTWRLVGADGPLTVDAPAAYDAPAAVLHGTDPRPQVTFVIDGGSLPIVQYIADWSTFDFETGNFVDWDVVVTPAYAAGASTVQFETPDLSGLPGYEPAMELETRLPITGTTFRSEATSLDEAAGTKSRTAGVEWTLGEYCGDGAVNGDEQCDDMAESATCNADCTTSVCGDGIVNTTAGEECDPADGTTCDDQCHLIPPAMASGFAVEPKKL